MKLYKKFLISAIAAISCICPLQASAIEKSIDIDNDTFIITATGSDFGQLNHFFCTKDRYDYEIEGGVCIHEASDIYYDYFTVFLNEDSEEVKVTLKPTGKFRENTEVVIFDSYYLMAETVVNENITPRGDINMDGYVGIADAVLLQKFILGSQDLSFIQYCRADVDNDNTVDCFDMVKMRQNLIKMLEGSYAD